MMKTRAAVAVEAGKPLEIMEVNLEGPKRGEVLIEIKATGERNKVAKSSAWAMFWKAFLRRIRLT